jgi:hypothetical protein
MRVLILILSAMLLATLGACGGGGGDAANCEAYCDKVFSCGVDTAPGCLEDCTADVTNASGACRSAYIATGDCVIGLSCEQAKAWWNETPPDSYPCKAQDDAEDNAC